MNPYKGALQDRETAWQVLRDALEENFFAEEEHVMLPGFSLCDDDQRACLELAEAIETVAYDIFRAALLADEARETCRAANWPELAHLSRLVQLLVAIDWNAAISQEITERNIPDTLPQRLMPMLEQLTATTPASDLVYMVPLMVMTHRRGVYPDPPEPDLDWDQWEAAVAGLTELVSLASNLGLENIAREAAHQVLQTQANLVTVACRTQDWPRAIALRTGYHQVWRQWKPDLLDPSANEDRTPMLAAAGQNIARLHARRSAHSVLLPENLGPDGSLKNLGSIVSRDPRLARIREEISNVANFARASEEMERFRQVLSETAAQETERTQPEDVDWLAEDLALLRYQLSPSEWQTFSLAYLEAEENPYAGEVIERVEAIVTADALAQEFARFPGVAYTAPHFSIRMCDHWLRHAPEAHNILNHALEGVKTMLDTDKRMGALLDNLLRADGVDWAIRSGCLNAIMGLLEDSYKQREYAQIERWCAQALPQLDGLMYPVPVPLFRGYLALVRAHLARDASEVVQQTEQAASEFLGWDPPHWRPFALDILHAGLQQAAEPADATRLAIIYVPAALEQAYLGRDLSHLHRCLAVAQRLAGTANDNVDGLFLSACADLVQARQASDEAARNGYLASARAKASSQIRFAELLLRLGLPQEAQSDNSNSERRLSDKVLQYLAQRQWLPAAAQLQVELEELEDLDPDSLDCRYTAANLAALLQQCVDFIPQQRWQLAGQVQVLAQRYGPAILQDAGTGVPGQAPIPAQNANKLGWAAISFSTYLEDGGQILLETGTQLLQQATRLAPSDSCPERFSTYANNLAVAYYLTTKGNSPEDLERLEQARDLIQQVIAVDEQLAQSPDPQQRAAGETLYMDYNNLGNICYQLASSTYQSELISVKSPQSAHWYREALDAFHQSRDLASSSGNLEIAADAEKKTALIYIDLANHYVQERYWSGGDLMKAFHDWLCEFQGGPVNTTLFVQRCASSALEELARAANLAMGRNPYLLIECLDGLVRLWSLGAWREALPTEIRRQIMATLLDIVHGMDVRGMVQNNPRDLEAIPSLEEYWSALMEVDSFRTGSGGATALQAAYQSFQALGQSSSGVTRSLARPYQAALEFSDQPDGLQVNGLFVRPTDQGIELHLPSQRRSVWISGPQIAVQRPALRPVHDLTSLGAVALAHLQPILHWDDLPSEVLVGKGEGHLGEEELFLETMRLPTGTWDCWLIRLETLHPPEDSLRLSLPFIGMYDVESGHLDISFPATLTKHSQILVFGEPGVTLEVMPYLDQEEMDAGKEVCITVQGRRESPELTLLEDRALVCTLKTSPRVTSADVAFVAKQDGSLGGTCCAASSPLVTPSLAFPANALHTFAPLFFFEDKLPPPAAEMLNQINPHEIVLVGAPQDSRSAADLLESLFDPRREVFWLVTEDELPAAEESVKELRARINSLPGAHFLLRSAASTTAMYDPTEHVQIFVAPRQFTAATAQMALDLAALRHYDMENIPVAVSGRVTYLNVKGNPLAYRLQSTLFKDATSWLTLLDRYCQLSKSSLMGNVLWNPDIPDPDQKLRAAIDPQLPKRPMFLVEADSSAVLVALPYARQLGAMLLPFNDISLGLLEQINPPEVYVPASRVIQVPSGSWEVHSYPDDTHELSFHHQAFTRQEYTRLLERLSTTHPHLVASQELLAEMQPSEYVVLALSGANEDAWSYLAANYAAALFAPIYLLEASVKARAELPNANLNFLSGPATELRSVDDSVRHLFRNDVAQVPDQLNNLIGTASADLVNMNPRYVSFVSSAPAFPIELAGDPPLATQFGVGRLAGPDLLSTSLLVTRAALSEDLNRPPGIFAVLAESHDALPAKTLPGALLEAQALDQVLRDQTGVEVVLINTPDDLSLFLKSINQANIVHFTGHGQYDNQNPENSGLVFRQGVLKPQQLDLPLSGMPLVFSNACETGLIVSTPDDERPSWTGLAASFIAQGAVNYLGSLWPIYDESSRRFSEVFYRRVLAGQTVGEALLDARRDAFNRNDVTWAAFAMFGCPRNRLRAEMKNDQEEVASAS